MCKETKGINKNKIDKCSGMLEVLELEEAVYIKLYNLKVKRDGIKLWVR